ncbi:MAG: MFS transporter [Caulobacteraceae bacterium]
MAAADITATPGVSAEDAPVVTRAYCKVFWRLMPFLMLCYVASYMDRVNIGFAKLQMQQELGFSETVFGLGSGIFFLGYFLFEVPSNILMHRVGARAWIARIMITWGLLSGAFIWVTSVPAFYGLRFVLGLGRGGILSRRDPLSDLLVPGALARAGDRDADVGHSGVLDPRQPAVGLGDGRDEQPGRRCRLEVDVHRRGGAGGARRDRRPVLSRQLHRRRQVAGRRREAGAGSRRGRGPGEPGERRAFDRPGLPRPACLVHVPDLLLFRAGAVRPELLDADPAQDRRRQGRHHHRPGQRPSPMSSPW